MTGEETKALVPKGVPSPTVQIKGRKRRTDLDRYASVASAIPTPNPLTMDGTSLAEITVMANDKYSGELVADVRRIFNFEKFVRLKDKNFQRYLNIGKFQIEEIWARYESLNTHTNMFNVAFLISIGLILNDIEASFGRKSLYMSWLRENFGHKHMRYFQQAKQLAHMGHFSRINAGLGKNRLLEFNRLQEQQGQSYEDLINLHPFEDITLDMDGSLFKEHVDAITTYYRLKENGIDFVEFDQAELIASFLHQPLGVKKTRAIKKWLDNQDDKEGAFNDLVMNKMVVPYDVPEVEISRASLNNLFAQIANFSEDIEAGDEEWVRLQKRRISREIMVNAYNVIIKLAGKLDIDLEESATDQEDQGEQEVVQ